MFQIINLDNKIYTVYLELVNAFEVITSCIRELDYHQSPVQDKTDVELADAAYL